MFTSGQGFGAVNMEAPMFHDRHLGDRVANFHALNRAMDFERADAIPTAPRSLGGALVALLFIVAFLTVLVT